jgi:hypothetical protein
MTAGIFAKHGVWTGGCRGSTAANFKGHFENLRLKEVLKREFPGVPQNNTRAVPPQGFKDVIVDTIRQDGYKGGPWLFKGTVMYWTALDALNPHYVCVFRDPDSIFASCRATRMYMPDAPDMDLMANILRQREEMTMLLRQRGAVPVYTDEIISGNYSSIANALTLYGITPDYDLIDEFVDPKLWRYGKRQ